ncbi:putative ATPase/DNA-binding SARP family transcriptional activator [Nocardioides sp. BE266]|uniref:BTAD domain-containing putative transcriptional regulator n=1 Tax=Nocardioides sp. BE266 TaxID=2817725 RepID=UPI00285D7B90|nr:BTAD domain-containing putative transcriptional regulator [Nocardioides sp. BE266]MDR7255417.1 putative ATPase/DNA-binding SARP family transcriptional activator [Nocardioides sp. BE266]
MLTVGVLGVVEARRDGEPVPLPAGKTTELLARLAVEPGIPVRVDAILEDLWGEPTARNTLQAKVSQLRRALGRDVVLGVDGAYVLALDPVRVDARRAVDLSAEAQAAARDGDAAVALDRAGAGVALFRGEVLAAAGDWAAPHRTRLEETRWTLVETLMAARVDLGAGADVVAELEALVAEQPLREGLWASLVTALYRAGRQGDALAAYDRVRRHLADELGIDPGPELRALEVGVLRQDATLGSGGRDEPARPGNVGAAPQPLVGRTSELAVVEGVDGRLVTLVGPAGVGKTRLATEVALRSSYPGGAWLVRLEAVDGTADLEQVVAETLRVGSGPTALIDRLEGAETLLVLDNCEHVVMEAAHLVEGLLARVSRLAVLATSQVPLGLAEEHLVPLAPMPPEDSVALFEQRARHHRPTFAVDGEHAEAVAQVCATLDHLPLAIELAAARVRSLPVEDIARRLDDRFALLRDPGSHAPERRRALDAAIGWSYELLFPDDQRVLWALSCFADGACVAALEAVTESLGVPPDAFADTVTRLVDRSLVRLDDGATPRYRMLDSVRAFSSARLAETGDEPVARAAHVGWYADRAARCADVVRSAEQAGCVAFARDERADLDGAVAWALVHDPPLAARIGLGMAWTWIVLGDGTAGAARIRAVLDAAGSDGERARGGLAAAWLESSAGDLALARADLDSAAALAATLDDALLAADVHWHAAFVAIQEGRPDVVLGESASALTSYRSRGTDWSVASALLLSAYGSLMVGDVATARAAAAEAQGILDEVDDAWGQTHAQGILAGIAEATGRSAEAATAFAGAADAAARLGFTGQAALHRASWARCLAAGGDDGAREAHERALAEASAVGDGRLAASVRLHLAQLLRASGEHDRALALLRQNQRWYAAAGGGDLEELNAAELASVAGEVVGPEDAMEHTRDRLR